MRKGGGRREYSGHEFWRGSICFCSRQAEEEEIATFPVVQKVEKHAVRRYGSLARFPALHAGCDRRLSPKKERGRGRISPLSFFFSAVFLPFVSSSSRCLFAEIATLPNYEEERRGHAETTRVGWLLCLFLVWCRKIHPLSFPPRLS